MKKGLSFLTIALAGVMTLFAVAPVSAFPWSARINAPKSFHAQFTLQIGANPAQHGTMYYSHGKIREEIIPADGGPKSITIIDPMSKSIYEVMEQKKLFKFHPWDPRSALLYEALRREGKRRFVQTQTINGQVCDNFEIEPHDKVVKPFFVFVNKTTRYPVRLTTQDPDPSKEIHIEWSDLSVGYQAAILFTPPLGYAELK